jgi:hypothetical protein
VVWLKTLKEKELYLLNNQVIAMKAICKLGPPARIIRRKSKQL